MFGGFFFFFLYRTINMGLISKHPVFSLSFLWWLFWQFCLISNGLHWVFYSILLMYKPISAQAQCCFHYSSSVIKLEIPYSNPSSIVLFAQDCFGNLGSFVLPFELLDYSVYFCEECHVVFVQIALNM